MAGRQPPLLLLLLLLTASAGTNTSIMFPGSVDTTSICAHPDCKCVLRNGLRDRGHVTGSRHADGGSTDAEEKMALCECKYKRILLTPHLFRGKAAEHVVLVHVAGSPDCSDVSVESGTFADSSVHEMVITGPMKVTLKQSSFKRQRINRAGFKLHINGSKDLILLDHSLAGEMSDLHFSNVHITTIQAKTFKIVDAKLADVTFRNATVDVVRSGAFEGSRLTRLVLDGCRLGEVQTGAIAPASLGELVISNSRITQLETSAVRADTAQFRLQNTTVVRMSSGAFNVTTDLATFQDNQLEHLDEDALRQIQPRGSQSRLEFRQNRLERLQPGSLALSGRYQPGQVEVSRVYLSRRCSCDLLDGLRDHIGPMLRKKLVQSAWCEDADGEERRLEEWRVGPCGGTGGRGLDRPGRRRRRAIFLWAVVGVVCGLLISCVLTGAVCWRLGLRRRRQKQRQAERTSQIATEVLHHRPHKLNNANIHPAGPPPCQQSTPHPERHLVMGVPDVKTYTETEVHVVMESLEPLEFSAAPDMTPEPFAKFFKPRRAGRLGSTGSSACAEDQLANGCRKSAPL